jgi:hypothetical protein
MYRGILNNSFWNKLRAILWRNSVRFGENFSDGAILEVIFLESRSKLSHLGRRVTLSTSSSLVHASA